MGRPSETLAGWRAVKATIWLRAGGRCEVCRLRAAQDPDHAVRRSAGGEDTPRNVLALCRGCHERRDASYVKGRLVFTPAPGGFTWEILRGASKWDPCETVAEGFIPTGPEAA